MRNWIRTAVIGTVMAWCVGPLLAFNANDNPDAGSCVSDTATCQDKTIIGGCEINKVFSTKLTKERARVSLSNKTIRPSSLWPDYPDQAGTQNGS